MNKVMFISCTLLFLAGCAIGSPKFVKINKNGSFLLTQGINKDIICVKSDRQDDKATGKTTRCFYVSGKYEESKWRPVSSTGSL